MHRFLGRYVQIFNKRHRRRGHLFQERFKSILVEEESQGLVLSSYIVLNPVNPASSRGPRSGSGAATTPVRD
ncbi:MAG TPA: hypothetical protein VF701_21065 [Thermoanaerobaculia bacterium]